MRNRDGLRSWDCCAAWDAPISENLAVIESCRLGNAVVYRRKLKGTEGAKGDGLIIFAREIFQFP